MRGGIDGRIFIITGGTQGLGEAIARRLAREGAAGLVITGRNTDRGIGVASALVDAGAEAVFVEAELGDLEQVRAIVPEAMARFGRVDGLVNAAAVTDRGTILSTEPELFDRIMAVNVRAPFFLMQDALRVMLHAGIEGAIVNILSMSGHGGQSFLAAYSASKTALGAITRNAAFALLPNRIRVNGLNIGWMDTPGEHAIQKRAHDAPETWLEEAEAARPFGRLLKPEEVAGAVAFLLSTESGLMTGSIVDMDQTVHGCWDQPPIPATALG